MHEGTIAQGILTNVLGALPPDRKVIVTRVSIKVGAHVGVVPESLELYFRELSRGTPAAEAKLDLHHSPAWLVCRSCAARIEHRSGTPIPLSCTACGGANRLEGGRELYLEEMEVQDFSDEKLDSGRDS